MHAYEELFDFVGAEADKRQQRTKTPDLDNERREKQFLSMSVLTAGTAETQWVDSC